MTSATLDALFPFTEPLLPTHTAVPGLTEPSVGGEHAVSTTPSIQPTMSDPSQQDLDDEGLILAICQGAEWAIESIYQRYYKHAYSLAYRLVHERTTAEDIAQEAFLSVWCKAASYQPQQGSVRNWLQAIVHHRAIDTVRAALHRDAQWIPLHPEQEQDLPSEQPEIWEEACRHERIRLISRVLAQLPPEQRRMIELGYFGGYTHAEIAEGWKIPLGTVKGRMRLGLQKMRHLLREQGVETAYE